MIDLILDVILIDKIIIWLENRYGSPIQELYNEDVRKAIV